MFWKKKSQKNEEENGLNGSDVVITNYLTDGLLVFDRSNRLFLINPQAKKILEVEETESLGRSSLELMRYEKIEPLINHLGAGLRECFREEIQLEENLILEVTTVHMKVGQQRVSTLLILHDITREKLSDRMKNEFVTLAAHQLRTPTSGIKWSLQTLLDGDLGQLNEKQKDIISQALSTNDKVIHLVNDLLNVAEIEEGRYLNKMVLSDISEIVFSVMEDYRQELERKNLQVDFIKPKQILPKVMLDIDKIKIAITNLFDNAVRYTLEGGKINVSIENFGKELEVKIEDNGIGIPFHQQEEIFKKFFRSANVKKVDTEGTGLGLYITKNIVEAHGGRIWFESEQDRGTAFYFTIPVKKKFGEYLTSDFY